METINEIINAIDKLQIEANERVVALQQIKMLLDSNAFKEGGKNLSLINSRIENKTHSTTFRKELYSGYPMNGRFRDKMDFLDNIHPQGWRLPERRDLIILIEGDELSKKTLDGITGKLQYLRKTGEWIVGKYGNVNKFSFYFKPNWLSPDGKSIKIEFAPSIEILKNLKEEKRHEKNIVWLS